VSGEAFYGPGYDDVEVRIADIDKAVRLLEWRPGVTLDQMLPAIIDDYVARYGDALRRSSPAALPR